MYTFLLILIAIVSVLIIGAVLLQSGKGDGLAGVAAAGYTNQLLGTRQAPDVLEKATWYLVGTFVVLCFLTAVFIPGKDEAKKVISAPTSTSAPATKPATQPKAN